jgi:LuxR family maltose regulon positive regulatory protein
LLFEGLSHVLEGDAQRADAVLAHSADVAVDLGALAAATVAIAQRALLAIERSDWDEASALSSRAVEIVQQRRFDEYLEASFAYVAAARVAIQRGDGVAARDLVARAARLRPLLTYAVPATALVLRELVTLYLNLADPAGAQTVLRELRDILRQRPHMGTLPAEAARLHDQFEAGRRRSIGASSLTVAELRVIPYLATHLSTDEIGKRLFVSRNTIKSQTVSVYRKLGVNSRSDAVARAQEIGLIPA